jgi:hypothetical protein
VIQRIVYSTLLLLFACYNTPAQPEVPSGLTLSGKVVNVRRLPDEDRYVRMKVGLNLEFVNSGTEPIILIRPWDARGYWHGASCLSTKVDSVRCYFSDGGWQSLSAGEDERKLANDLDQPAPPPSFTRTLKPGESWEWFSEIQLSFEDNPKSYKVPWQEMKTLGPTLWLRVSFELWPFNVEVFKPDLAARLQKRWRRYGNMWIGERNGGGMHLARLTSVPMKVDWSAAIASQ